MIPSEIFPAPGAIETNPGLSFDRAAAGTAVRFEPGQSREVRLVPYQGHRRLYGFNGHGWGNWRASVAQTSNQTRELRDGNARTNGADHESYR